MKTIKPNKSVGRARLMALASHIKKRLDDPQWVKFFKMDQWADPSGVRAKAYIKKHGKPVEGKKVVVNGSCGTSACLLGHGTNVPMLAKAGLHALIQNGKPVLYVGDTEVADYEDEKIAVELFGISERRFDEIFRYTGEHRDIARVGAAEAHANMMWVIAKIDAYDDWMI